MERKRWLRRVWSQMAVVLVAVLASLNVVMNDFAYDDLTYMHDDQSLHEPLNVGRMFTEKIVPSNPHAVYRPILKWSIAVDAGVSSLLGLKPSNPIIFRIDNILLHAGVSLLFLLLLQHLTVPFWARVLGASLFAAHPVHVEVLSSFVNRSELLAALFGLGFLLVHGRRGSRVLAGFLLFLSLGGKETGVLFVGCAVIIDFMMTSLGEWRSTVLRYLSYAPWVGVFLGLRWYSVGGLDVHPIFELNPLSVEGAWVRILTALKGQVLYLSLLLVPVGLSYDYSYNQIPVVGSLFDSGVLGFFAVLGLAGWVAWRQRKDHPVVIGSLLSYGVLFSLTSNLIAPVAVQFAERYAYAPSALFCLLVGYGIWYVARVRSPYALGLGVALVVVFAGLTFWQSATWRNELAMTSQGVRASPQSAKAHRDYGAVLLTHGQADLAVKVLARAVQISPRYREALLKLADAYEARGDSSAVVQILRKVKSLNDDDLYVRYRLAQFLVTSEPREAFELASEVLVQEPGEQPALLLAMDVAKRNGWQSDGRTLLRKAQEKGAGVMVLLSGWNVLLRDDPLEFANPDLATGYFLAQRGDALMALKLLQQGLAAAPSLDDGERILFTLLLGQAERGHIFPE